MCIPFILFYFISFLFFFFLSSRKRYFLGVLGTKKNSSTCSTMIKQRSIESWRSILYFSCRGEKKEGKKIKICWKEKEEEEEKKNKEKKLWVNRQNQTLDRIWSRTRVVTKSFRSLSIRIHICSFSSLTLLTLGSLLGKIMIVILVAITRFSNMSKISWRVEKRGSEKTSRRVVNVDRNDV